MFSCPALIFPTTQLHEYRLPAKIHLQGCPTLQAAVGSTGQQGHENPS